MKIFYTSSSTFFTNHKDIYKSGTKFLKSKGHSIFDFLVTSTEETKAKDITEELFTKVAKQQLTGIKNSDILIAEITDSSGAVGFHIATALAEKKPVLVLRKKKDKKDQVLGPIIGHTSKLLKFSEYSTVEERNKAIEDILEWSKNKLDTKFILIISPEINRYLEWSSQENRVHKAQIVRDAIERIMKKDKRYKNILDEEN